MRQHPVFLALVALVAVDFAAASGAPAHDAAASPLLASLGSRVAADPGDAAARRLFGRALLQAGDVAGALPQLAAAVEIDPLSAAARCDYGRALAASGDPAAAAEQWRQAAELAPDSDYAAEAERRLAELPPDDGRVTPADYTIREFPGPPLDPVFDPADGPAEAAPPGKWPLAVRLETGLLYDTNVALAPLSRQLAPGDRAGFQLFAAPEVEWAAAKGDGPWGGGWAAGPLFYGRFTLNEEDFRGLDLQSYAPGLFAEAALPRQAGTLVPRLEYRFTLDELGGEPLGRRHGVTGRLTALEEDGDATIGYLAADHTDFADDGVLPEVTSADGLLYAGGLARETALDSRYLSRVRFGLDLDRLDARGSDYAYYGTGLTGEAVVPLVPTLELRVRGGLGYRLYDRFEFEPSRDEIVSRVGGEVRKWFTANLSAAAVASYQRFDSENPLFAADRFLAGVVAEYLY